jgi:exopolysaccharide production protein ExoY
MTKTDESFEGFAQKSRGHWQHSEMAQAPSAYRQFFKRGFDIGLILLALPALLLLIFALSILLICVQGGSPFFGHLRVGRNGAPFRCWKLRTMTPDAEARLQAHLQHDPLAAQEWARSFKLAADPRVTPLGRILRRTSLDELPQIWNILKGEMSLVGPRPVTAAETALYGPALRQYQALRPGLTGLWQVNGRNGISYAERVAMDVAYGSQLSLAGDVQILAATIKTVLLRSGQ